MVSVSRLIIYMKVRLRNIGYPNVSISHKLANHQPILCLKDISEIRVEKRFNLQWSRGNRVIRINNMSNNALPTSF